MAESNLSDEERRSKLEALAASLPGEPVTREEAFPRKRRTARSIAMHRAALEEARSERQRTQSLDAPDAPKFKITRSPFAPKLAPSTGARPAMPASGKPVLPSALGSKSEEPKLPEELTATASETKPEPLKPTMSDIPPPQPPKKPDFEPEPEPEPEFNLPEEDIEDDFEIATAALDAPSDTENIMDSSDTPPPNKPVLPPAPAAAGEDLSGAPKLPPASAEPAAPAAPKPAMTTPGASRAPIPMSVPQAAFSAPGEPGTGPQFSEFDDDDEQVGVGMLVLDLVAAVAAITFTVLVFMQLTKYL